MKKNIDIKIDETVIGTFVADEGDDFRNAMIAAKRMLELFPEAYLYVTDKETGQAIEDICSRVEEMREQAEAYKENYYEDSDFNEEDDYDEYDDYDEDCDRCCKCDNCHNDCCRGCEKDFDCDNCFYHEYESEEDCCDCDEDEILSVLLEESQDLENINDNDLVDNILLANSLIHANPDHVEELLKRLSKKLKGN